jgi:hypothetical protein
MWRSKRSKTEREQLDRVVSELLRAVKVSEAEIEAVADSGELYRRVRSRIAAERRRQANERASTDGWLAMAQTQLAIIAALGRRRWILAATAVVLILLVAVAPRWVSQPEQKQIEVVLTSTPQEGATESVNLSSYPGLEKEAAASLRSGVRQNSTQMRRWQAEAAEVATDYLPLTYLVETAVPESGLVVRVQIPRLALVSLGVPINVERAGELVQADVVIGDDGLARAIRFIQ